MSLLAMEEVWELHGVLDEEDWGVVANHVVVSFFGVELDGESTRISVAIVGSTLSSNGGESEEDWSSLANLAEEGCLGEAGDIFSDLQETMSASSLGMDDSLWESLSGEVSKLVQKGEILSQDWSSWASGERVLIVINWGTT
jgi:hypothetical protein